ncbi:hypothetical protein HMPREF0208_03425 [Citrobacter koseri]|nr:hypothetical protein HMPREF3207_01795 [Citrobacter koseri]KXA03885.1 hypothetical protein HMPREF3220_00493 [Citrobacter koseri]KXB41894.1 hypothetical protein HMPREF0208_03425 [Citrobacter koseri]
MQLEIVCKYLSQVTKNTLSSLIESHHIATANVPFKTFIRYMV